jgi:hypothetical protein
MRTTSRALRETIFAQETDDVVTILLTINHPSITEPIRVCLDNANIVSRGDTYVSFPFSLVLPDDTNDNPPAATIEISNVDKQITDALQTITSPPTLLMEIIRVADPDVVEISLPEFTMTQVKIDVMTIQASLAIENMAIEPYPSAQFTPSGFPGLF